MEQSKLRLPATAAGRLELQAPGGSRFSVIANGRGVTAKFASLSDLAKTVRDLPRGQVGEKSSLRSATVCVSNLGAVTGMTFHVTARGRRVVEMGPTVNPSWIARLLRLGPISIRTWNVLAASLGFRGNPDLSE